MSSSSSVQFKYYLFNQVGEIAGNEMSPTKRQQRQGTKIPPLTECRKTKLGETRLSQGGGGCSTPTPYKYSKVHFLAHSHLTGNLATGRTVTQSSTIGTWFVQQAIDFNPGFTKPSSSCSSTTGQTNPWWRVDLHYIYRVSRVVVTNRLDCCPERINGAEIRIGNSLENNGNNNPM